MINASIGSWNASSEGTETQFGKKKLILESQPMLQTGNLRASTQVVLKSWNLPSILTGTSHPNWQGWNIARLGSLPPGTAIQPYAAAGPVAIKPWTALGIPTGTPSPNRKSWTIAMQGSLDAAQKYGTNPAILELHFGHRP
jgi:hypothetical protein